LEADAPVVIDPIKAADDIKTAVVEKRIPVEVAVSGAQLQVRDRLNGNIRVHFGESFVECRNLRVDRERRPWQRSKTQPIEKVRIRRAIVRAVDVRIEKCVQLQPGHRQIVAPRLKPIPNSHPPDRRAIDRIDGSELREINRTELGGGLEAVELQNRRRIY